MSTKSQVNEGEDLREAITWLDSSQSPAVPTTAPTVTEVIKYDASAGTTAPDATLSGGATITLIAGGVAGTYELLVPTGANCEAGDCVWVYFQATSEGSTRTGCCAIKIVNPVVNLPGFKGF